MFASFPSTPFRSILLVFLSLSLVLASPGVPGAFALPGEGRGPAPSPREAIEAALDWLAGAQSPDGRWDCDALGGHALYDVGVTGLALLAFLGAGETHEAGPHKEAVKKGLAWLRGEQDPKGCFGTRAYDNFVYGHAIGTLAMSEAYGLTRSPLFAKSARRGVEFIHAIKNPHRAWRYGIRPGDNDTSVTGWMVCALVSARAAGLPVPEGDLADARAFIDSVTDEVGRVGYVKRGVGPVRPQGKEETYPAAFSESLTAIGILTRIMTGEKPGESAAIRKGIALCTGKLPQWVEPKLDFYYWYYGTLAMVQAGGTGWRWWHEALRDAILDRQEAAGRERGSWDPVDAWGSDGGRVYSTALLAMCLEVADRYTRAAPKKPRAKKKI